MSTPRTATADVTDPTTDTPNTTPADTHGPVASPTPATGQTGSPSTTRNAVRATTVAAVSVVAAVAAVVSFMHMYELATRAGEEWRAWLIPLAIDGLVVAASMTMVVRRRTGRKASWLAWVSMILGIAASLAANIAAAEPTLIGRAVAAWPPIALLLAYELLMDQLGTKHATPQPVHPYQPPAAHGLAVLPPSTATARQDGTTSRRSARTPVLPRQP
nr:DUF2637 domain-containing protein [Kibdelosporangium sp. MJ126-NF4]CEL13511.1 SpdA protein [Kibdelosporangium sp. MJ126-NF4]CTQ99196.1 SpdA protein [Kibdelosporangium sp. MJ126-NF4]